MTTTTVIIRNLCPPSPSVQSLLYKNDYDNTDDEEENDDDEVDDDDEDVDEKDDEDDDDGEEDEWLSWSVS
jgi:ABC-type Zn2+ transport system substrate-binding protein/surface adhesin